MSRLYRRLIFGKGYPACESAGKSKAAETELPDILQRENPFLAVDNPTIQALQLLTGHFEAETGIQVEFHCVPQNQLLSMISESCSTLTQTYDFYTYDVPWLEYMVQNMCLADISSFIESDSFRRISFFSQVSKTAS